MKALGPVVSDKKFFKSFILKHIYWPRDLLMQPTGMVWTYLIKDHTGIIPVKFGQIPNSGSREDVVWSFPYIIQCKIVTRGGVNFDPRGIIWTTLVEDLQMMLFTTYESSGPCCFRQEDFWKFHFKNLFIDPVTYLCNQLEQFEQLW